MHPDVLLYAAEKYLMTATAGPWTTMTWTMTTSGSTKRLCTWRTAKMVKGMLDLRFN